MKILKEAKEKLPISFITDFISNGWDEVGILKADIEAIESEFSSTKEISKLIQDLIDAYLVCIGQMEAHLHEKDYIEYPEDSKLTESVTEEAPKLEEDINIKIEADKVKIEEEAPEVEEVKPVIDEPVVEAPKATSETFEYFCDFDEPCEAKPLSDEEIEELQKSI